VAGRVIVVMGPTGSGKGTQSELLAKHLKGVHISSGQLLRNDNDQEIIRAVNSGDLAPSQYIEELVGRALAKIDADKPVVLDGFPRRMSDVHWLEKNLPTSGRQLAEVILLTATKAEIIDRILKRGRPDDSEPALEEKWQDYKSITMPVVAHFRERKLVREVDGVGSVKAVAARVAKVVK
jgi:adenylate kinase